MRASEASAAGVAGASARRNPFAGIRGLLALGPTALFLFSALTIGWSVAQIANRRAAALAVLMTIVASPRALAVFMAAPLPACWAASSGWRATS